MTHLGCKNELTDDVGRMLTTVRGAHDLRSSLGTDAIICGNGGRRRQKGKGSLLGRLDKEAEGHLVPTNTPVGGKRPGSGSFWIQN